MTRSEVEALGGMYVRPADSRWNPLYIGADLASRRWGSKTPIIVVEVPSEDTGGIYCDATRIGERAEFLYGRAYGPYKPGHLWSIPAKAWIDAGLPWPGTDAQLAEVTA